jgi:hypothetical protein
MGGRALKQYGVETERKNTDEFLKIGNEIQTQINLSFAGLLESTIVTCYHSKADHGDLDVLLKITHDFHNKNVNLREYIQNTFKPNAINNNGGVYSFDYKNFQIDFIPIKESKWETAKIYFSYDPLGNIMGKTFHKFGLSYGWDGLFYKFRNFNGTNSQDILLTTDIRKIFEFGGYDFDRYLLGFETLEDIIKFCIDGKYFDSEMFEMENLNHIDRKRNRKRGSYHLFLNYLKDNNITTKFEFKKNKVDYIPLINQTFPEANFLEKLNILAEKDRQNKILAQKFNGDLVMSWLPDLKGKELGKVITDFKVALGDDYNDFILNNNYDVIRNYFMEIYNGNNK